MDPPYYDNVMYAELSDFFYVWLKRTAGHVFPELFRRKLTDKENEAVANPARFAGQPGAPALAERDYRQRMAAIFAECRRVLKADGVMTLMFTHKATGAWDALTTGLIEAGFAITASWPVNTEAEGSLHIKDRAAANSTILIDALHHAACAVRTQSIAAAAELLARAGLDRELRLFAALEAVLEILPPSRAFTGVVLEGAVEASSSDFEALYHLYRFAYDDRIDEPDQLRLWREER